MNLTSFIAQQELLPQNKLSIPRKELNALLLCCEKLIFIALNLKIAETNIFAHSDSLVTLHWVQKDINSLKTYVSNRVKKIQDTHIKLFYVPGKQNPADLCSKPQPGKDYINNEFWINGPSYIQEDNNTWMDEKELNYVTKIKLPEQDEDTLTLELKPQVQATVLLADAEDIVPSSKRKTEDELIGPDGI